MCSFVQKVENEKLLKNSTKNAFLVGYQVRRCLKLLSPTHKKAILTGYHLKSFESQWTNRPSHRLSPERRFNPMVKKRPFSSATN